MRRLLYAAFACHAATLLGTRTLAAPGPARNTPRGFDLPVDNLQIEQINRQADGSSLGSDERDWNQLQNESPWVWELAFVSAPPERASEPGPDNQWCSHSKGNGICPYSCEQECPCFNYCIEKTCFLIAWGYDPQKFSCVSGVQIFEAVIDRHLFLVQNGIDSMCHSYCIHHCVGDQTTSPQKVKENLLMKYKDAIKKIVNQNSGVSKKQF